MFSNLVDEVFYSITFSTQLNSLELEEFGESIVFEKNSLFTKNDLY